MKESQRVEWKETWRDDCLKVISGFANAEGGTLVIGKNDAGDVVGAKDARKLLEDLPNKVRDILGILVDVNLKKRAGREYLEIVIPAYTNPISYRGEFYYRSGSTNQALKGASLERFLLRKQGRTWDSVAALHVSLRDLSRPAIATFRLLAKQGLRHDSTVQREPIPSLIEKLGLRDGKHLNLAAVLLFHPEPDRFVPGAFVKIGYFRSESDLLYQDEIKGDLFTQARQTIDLLLTKYLRAAISYQGIQRVESFPLPEEALREAVLNALIHRDYAVGAPIQIRVYADRLSIWNPGELPEGWSVATLLRPHASRPYNPLVARAFFRAGEIEAWGRGVQGIFEACKTAGTPKPKIRSEARDIWVEFPFLGSTTPITTQETAKNTTQETPKKSGVTSEVTSEVTGEVTSEVTGDVVRLLRACEGSMSRRDLRERLALKSDDNFRQLYLVPALKAGLLRMTIPDKPNSRLQKYFLSSEGSALLASLPRPKKGK